jgi:hypothetical protein
VAAGDGFLTRWSRRKAQAREGAKEPEPPPGQAVPAAAPGQPPAPAAGPPEPAPLPPVESLTPQSDFAPFMAPEVDAGLRRAALKTLFSDPHFNTMDMLDVYVDDYSRPDPLPAGWLEKLEQLSRLGDAAGRDREEAERRRLAAQERERPVPVEAPAGAGGTSRAHPEGKQEEGARAGEGAGETRPIPPRAQGESGT